MFWMTFSRVNTFGRTQSMTRVLPFSAETSRVWIQGCVGQHSSWISCFSPLWLRSLYTTGARDVMNTSCAFSLSASFKAVSKRINQKNTLKGSSKLFFLYSLACSTVHAWLNACLQLSRWRGMSRLGLITACFCVNALSPGFTDRSAIRAVRFMSLSAHARTGGGEGGAARPPRGVCVYVCFCGMGGPQLKGSMQCPTRC